MPDNSLWLGLLFSVPIGIGTSLATPYLQRWLERKGRNVT